MTLSAAPAKPAQGPNPRPLALLLLVISFMGGSCQLNGLMRGEVQVAERADIEKELKERGAANGVTVTPEVVDTVQAVSTELKMAFTRFRPFEVGFGLILLLAYALAMVAAMRAARFEDGSAEQLSAICLIVAPARVAVAAIDLAFDERMAAAIGRAMEAIMRSWRPPDGQAIPPDFPELMRELAATLQAGFILSHLAFAAAITLVFTWGWRYFQRPEVVSVMKARAPKPS